MSIVLAVRLRAKAGHEDALRGVLLALAAVSRSEAGCLAYQPHATPDDPGLFFLYEHWADQDSLDRHRSTEDFERLARVELREALELSEPLVLEPFGP
jgi:quinol monooxygenase YgiN